MSLKSPAPETATETGEHRRLALSLDVWADRDWSNGIHLGDLDEFQRIQVCTRNSLYELVVMNHAGDVRVRGGRYFPEWTPARLAGSTAGGSFLKQLGIIINLQMEFQVGARQIVTSAVRAISILEPAGPA